MAAIWKIVEKLAGQSKEKTDRVSSKFLYD
jgi:hypothetical protein